ncbi:hypothetical protein KL949_002255 [Ogataea haglerorum]|nr:hypothetical protein KL950_002479 [Ogataea haglerorum]KAG7717349.1 hypothetical protein KL913_003100 [Ogataea haglerorum]KAG7719263.1 hypothetical protein KL949_002255 [Ogataea haglerorum]
MSSLFNRSKNKVIVLTLACLLLLGVMYMMPTDSNVGAHGIKRLTESDIGIAPGRSNNEDTESDSELVLESIQPGSIGSQEIAGAQKEEQEMEDREEIKAISKEVSKLDNKGAGSLEGIKEKSHFGGKLEKDGDALDTKNREVVEEGETNLVDDHINVSDVPAEETPQSAHEKSEDISFTLSEESRALNNNKKNYQAGSNPTSKLDPAKKQAKTDSRRPKNLGKISDNRVIGTEDGPSSSIRLAQRSR